MQFGLGAAARGDEVPAVDHGGGQVLVVDEASGAGTPGRAGLGLIALGGEVADAARRLRGARGGFGLGR